MKRLLIHPIGLALLAVFSWSATAAGADYSFSLNGPNTAENDAGRSACRCLSMLPHRS